MPLAPLCSAEEGIELPAFLPDLVVVGESGCHLLLPITLVGTELWLQRASKERGGRSQGSWPGEDWRAPGEKAG